MQSILQPYDEVFKFVNVLDALIIFNLNLLNALAVYNFYSVIDVQGESNTAIAFQLVFTYLPLLYVLIRFVLWLQSKGVLRLFKNIPCTLCSDVDNRPNNDENASENDPLLSSDDIIRGSINQDRRARQTLGGQRTHQLELQATDSYH